jgi:hypothetical protein
MQIFSFIYQYSLFLSPWIRKNISSTTHPADPQPWMLPFQIVSAPLKKMATPSSHVELKQHQHEVSIQQQQHEVSIQQQQHEVSIQQHEVIIQQHEVSIQQHEVSI